MKEGFYLSPDGLHIVEIIRVVACPEYYKVYNNIDLFYRCTTALLEGHEKEMPTLFSTWEVLE